MVKNKKDVNITGEMKARTLINSAQQSIILIDSNYNILTINEAGARRLGGDAAGINGTNLFDFGPQDLKDLRKGYYEEVFKTGEPVVFQEQQGDKYFEQNVYPVFDEYGKTTGAAVFVQDITKRKLAEEELKNLNQLLSRSNTELENMAYVASHDLQEPLRMVAGYVQLLARRYQGRLDSEADEFISCVVDGVKRMQALINSLLTYSRLETRGGEFLPTDMNVVLKHALDNLKYVIEDSNTIITHDHLPVVSGDELQLVQLFQNIISNAIKYSGGKKPRVHIGVLHETNRWVFSIRDNGIGIEPQFFRRIFLLFQRLHSRSEYEGSGIGLAYCKKIVERHGGEIWVESTPGEGSVFYFSIPMRCQNVSSGNQGVVG